MSSYPLSAVDLGRTQRSFEEHDSPQRDPFRRDRDRVVHSQAFRRLAHKTQVFSYLEGDHYRTRLTHTIEVAQIARSVARDLGLNSDLAEAIALAHDLGHTPFGHTGEEALSDCMAPYGGFEHNAQTLRIVTKLEQRYANFDGLNLTFETLDGIIKHNGPVRARASAFSQDPGSANGLATPRTALPFALEAFVAEHPAFAKFSDFHQHGCLEAQVAALSDDVAYTAHDIDDGVRAGLLALEDLTTISIARDVLGQVDRAYPNLPKSRRMGEFSRRLITALIEALEGETRARIERFGIKQANDVLACASPIVAFPDTVAQDLWLAKQFLFETLYRNDGIVALRKQADRVVRNLFQHFMADPARMPLRWRPSRHEHDPSVLARRVCDFIAGMTDRFALSAHDAAFDHTPDLRYGAP
ncbi:MAG: deoxyguanosinetriphosphate triphosphohydrolase [Pseudomonadota bacterium]